MEFFRQFDRPLLAQIGRSDHQQAALPFRPLLRQQQSGFNGLPEPDFVGENRPVRKRILESEQGGFDLMRVQIDLGIGQRPGKLFDAVGRTLFGQIVCEEFRMKNRELDGFRSPAPRTSATIQGNPRELQLIVLSCFLETGRVWTAESTEVSPW